MNKTDTTKIEKIIPELKAKERKAALKEMASSIAPLISVDADVLFKALLEREKTKTTTLEKTGIAIPHAHIPGITKFSVLFAKSKNGIDFHAEDGLPSHLFFMMVGPEDNPSDYLRLLARVTRICLDEPFRKQLMNASSLEEITALFKDRNKKI